MRLSLVSGGLLVAAVSAAIGVQASSQASSAVLVPASTQNHVVITSARHRLNETATPVVDVEMAIAPGVQSVRAVVFIANPGGRLVGLHVFDFAPGSVGTLPLRDAVVDGAMSLVITHVFTAEHEWAANDATVLAAAMGQGPVSGSWESRVREAEQPVFAVGFGCDYALCGAGRSLCIGMCGDGCVSRSSCNLSTCSSTCTCKATEACAADDGDVRRCRL